MPRDIDESQYRIYTASWGSTVGFITLLMFGLAAVALLAAWHAQRNVAIVAGLAALFFGLCGWAAGKPVLKKAPILRIGPRGVSGHFLNNRTVPWSELRDVRIEAVQGHRFVVLTLMAGAAALEKTKRWLSGKSLERRIPLGALSKKQQADAAEAVQEAFVRYASGSAMASVQAKQEELAATVAFEQSLRTLTPTTWALYAVVALNVGVWVANIATGMSPMTPKTADLFRWGANSASAVLRDGEAWRLLTATFLHGGIMHLAFNMLGLWDAGRQLNRLHGNAQFLLIYLASALVGSGLSLHFSAQASVSVGASGAVFGVLGALLVALMRHKENMPALFGKQAITGQVVFLVYALTQGFARQGVDNAAHVGGLLAGAAMAWLLVEKIDEGDRRSQRVARAVTSIALAGVAVVALVWTTPQPLIDHRRAFAAERVMQAALPRLQAAQQAMMADVTALKAGKLTEPQLIELVQKKHLPAMRAAHAEFASVELPPGDPRAAVVADLQQLSAKSIEAMELELRVSRGEVDAASAQARMQALTTELRAINERLKARAAQPRK